MAFDADLVPERAMSIQACDDYSRPKGVMGGPCLNCGRSQPEHVNRKLPMFCRELKFGECPHCHGSLTADHRCPGKEAADEALASMLAKPAKIVNMIRLWLAVNNVEQTELAKAWGASTATVSRFLSGQNMPDGRTTARIVSWLLEP
jgi:predicted XRE-type DNA-binding protein